MKYPAKSLFYCAIVRKDERRTKSPMKNFIPYFYLSYISIRNYLKICSLFPTKRSNFIMLLYSPCLARGIKGWMHQRISEMRFERFRSIFKPIFFPFFLLFRRDSIEMETRNDTNWTYPREKAHQTLIDRPISECGTEMRGFLRFV